MSSLMGDEKKSKVGWTAIIVSVCTVVGMGFEHYDKRSLRDGAKGAIAATQVDLSKLTEKVAKMQGAQEQREKLCTCYRKPAPRTETPSPAPQPAPVPKKTKRIRELQPRVQQRAREMKW